MKKRIILISTLVVVMLLTVFAFSNKEDSMTDQAEIASNEITSSDNNVIINTTVDVAPEFFYDMGTRFRGITKTELNSLLSYNDLIGKKHQLRIENYTSLCVIVMEDNEQTDINIKGDSGVFTTAQLELLQSADYSTNFRVWAHYTERNKETGIVEESSWAPHLTVVPEKQAAYSEGEEAVIAYLREHSREQTEMVDQDKLGPGRVFFTVTKEGTITNVKLTSGTGYPSLDKTVSELIMSLPGEWKAAENTKGEKVDQELVILFGNGGC